LVKLAAVLRLLEKGGPNAAENVVGAFLGQVEALVRSQRLSDGDAQPLRDQAVCARAQLRGSPATPSTTGAEQGAEAHQGH
jgi:hypothetical protein